MTTENIYTTFTVLSTYHNITIHYKNKPCSFLLIKHLFYYLHGMFIIFFFYLMAIICQMVVNSNLSLQMGGRGLGDTQTKFTASVCAVMGTPLPTQLLAVISLRQAHSEIKQYLEVILSMYYSCVHFASVQIKCVFITTTPRPCKSLRSVAYLS